VGWVEGKNKGKIGNRKSEIGNRKSEIGNRKSEIGNRKSEIGNRKSESEKPEGGRGNRAHHKFLTMKGMEGMGRDDFISD